MNIATIPQSEIKRWEGYHNLSRRAWYNREPKAWCAWFMRPLQKLRHRWADALLGTIVAAGICSVAFAITAQWLS